MILLVLFIIIQTADVWTTREALSRGAREANFLPAALIDRFGFWRAALGVKAAAGAIALLVTLFVASAWVFTGVLDLLGLAVLANNWRVLKSL